MLISSKLTLWRNEMVPKVYAPIFHKSYIAKQRHGKFSNITVKSKHAKIRIDIKSVENKNIFQRYST